MPPEVKKKSGAAGLRESGKTAITIFVDAETLADIDAACETRYGKLPRTAILMTALNEFLDKENS